MCSIRSCLIYLLWRSSWVYFYEVCSVYGIIDISRWFIKAYQIEFLTLTKELSWPFVIRSNFVRKIKLEMWYALRIIYIYGQKMYTVVWVNDTLFPVFNALSIYYICSTYIKTCQPTFGLMPMDVVNNILYINFTWNQRSLLVLHM